MRRFEFAKGMNDHFHIRDSGRFIDIVMLQATGKCTLDVIAFDDFLQETYGKFDEKTSTSDFIQKQFGTEAQEWARFAAGLH